MKKFKIFTLLAILSLSLIGCGNTNISKDLETTIEENLTEENLETLIDEVEESVEQLNSDTVDTKETNVTKTDDTKKTDVAKTDDTKKTTDTTDKSDKSDEKDDTDDLDTSDKKSDTVKTTDNKKVETSTNKSDKTTITTTNKTQTTDKTKLEADKKTEADKKAKLEADKKAKEEADKAKAEADKKAKEEADRKAAEKAEADRKAAEQAKAEAEANKPCSHPNMKGRTEEGTCSRPSYHVNYCPDCKFEQYIEDGWGKHQWGPEQVISAATCSDAEMSGKYCTECGALESEYMSGPPLTCVDNNGDYYCDLCGEGSGPPEEPEIPQDVLDYWAEHGKPGE